MIHAFHRWLNNRRLERSMKPNPGYWRRWFAHIPANRQARRRGLYRRILAELENA